MMIYINKLLKQTVIITLCWLPVSASLAANCSDSESLKTLKETGNSVAALQELDKCLSTAEQTSIEELTVYNDLIKQVLTNNESTSLDEVYQNFQSVLKLHLLKDLEFEFADYFKENPKDDAKLFAEVRQEGETYQFYYDTGRMFSHSRGIALTNQALIWKNLTGEPQRLSFDELNNITLIFERGLSLTGWKLRVNNNENYDIRLSGVPEEAIQPLVSAMLYFINSSQAATDKKLIELEVPQREVAILAGWVTLCNDTRATSEDPIKNLQLLDACFASYGEDFKLSKDDSELLSQLTDQIFQQEVSFEEGYNNFKTILSTHFFGNLSFKFKDNIDSALDAELFKEVRQPEETYYFYFDTGKIASGSRGLALTDKSIIWKNLVGSSISWKKLTGEASQLTFDKISSVALVHEIGLKSITGWKLKLNDSEDFEIGLPELAEENIELFAKSVVYFINLAFEAQLTLQLSEETRDVLTKTFLERHPKIKSVTDSIFSVIMPEKSAEPAEEASAEEAAATETESSVESPSEEQTTAPSSDEDNSEATENSSSEDEAANSGEEIEEEMESESEPSETEEVVSESSDENTEATPEESDAETETTETDVEESTESSDETTDESSSETDATTSK